MIKSRFLSDATDEYLDKRNVFKELDGNEDNIEMISDVYDALTGSNWLSK